MISYHKFLSLNIWNELQNDGDINEDVTLLVLD